MKELKSKLIYIDSQARIYGNTYDFGVEIPSTFTMQDKTTNTISLSLVDTQIRSTWYNLRDSNNKFWLINYDVNLGSYMTTDGVTKTPMARWKTVPSEQPGTSWSPDTPNHWLIEILPLGNYDIRGLAQVIQNSLNKGYDGVDTYVGCNSYPDCRECSVTMKDTEGTTRSWIGSLFFDDGGTSQGQGLNWTVTWNATDGKMQFSYTGGRATTNLAFDFRTTGGFMFCDFYDKQGYGITQFKEYDIKSGAYELMGYDRHGVQSNLYEGTDYEVDRRGFPPQAEWLGGYDTYEDGFPVTGITNADNPVGGGLPHPATSDHPCLIGAPKSIFINTNLPLQNIGAYKKIGSWGGVAMEINTEFTTSNIFAKIMNNAQWYSTIMFQSQGEEDYVLKTEDLQYINTIRFWLSDEWGFFLKTQHDWSMTLKWTESEDDNKERNEALVKMNEMLQMILLQKEAEGIPLELSKVDKPNEKLLAPREIAAKKASEKVQQERDIIAEKPFIHENITKKKLDEEIDEEFKKAAVFGDEGGEVEQPPNDGWVREYRPNYKGDGGDLEEGENHQRHISGSGFGTRLTNLPYSYSGPGTKYKMRVARGDKGINPLDVAAKEHDRVYADKLATKEEIRKADLVLEKTAEAVAKKYPELWKDAMFVANAFKAKKLAVRFGLADTSLFAAGGKNNEKRSQ